MDLRFIIYNKWMGEPKEVMHQCKVMIDEGRPNDMAWLLMNYPRMKELIHCLDHEGKNVFHRAIEIRDESLCLRTLEWLVKCGGDVKHKDINKQNILFFAARHEKEGVVSWLLGFNFPLNDDDFFMQTPLFYAAKFNRGARVAELLLRAGCDVNHKDGNGQTCLFYAAGSGNLDICRLFVDFGANVTLLDRNREKASNYARKKGHQRIVDYLNGCLQEVKKIKDDRERRVQDSSQNEFRKKKETTRNEYCLIYTNQNGESRRLTPSQLQQFRAASEENEKLYRMLADPQEPVQGLGPVPDKRFERVAMKILTYFMRLQHSHPFHEPVNFVAHGLLDYPTIVKYPMDFGTIKRKLTLNAYENQLQFQEDMNLVFDNCILYNGTDKDIGKMALQMKMEFNTMFVKDFSV